MPVHLHSSASYDVVMKNGLYTPASVPYVEEWFEHPFVFVRDPRQGEDPHANAVPYTTTWGNNHTMIGLQ